jgi:UDP-glucose 4-epimerase
MRALITGGAGFIGSYLAEALVRRGHRVCVLDDLSTGRIENITHLVGQPGFSYAIDTVTNESLLGELIDQSDVVFHLAAAVGVKLVVEAPIHTIETNVHGTETVLRQASRHGKRVLIASTSEVYGKGAVLPFREDADLVLGPPAKHRWGYAASKLIDEFMAIAYWKERGLPVVVVRLFNTVGPRQSSRYGMVIPNFVRQALSGQPITVHGDGSQTRSFTSVHDVVWALMALMDEPRTIGEVFNIGNGSETTIRDLACRVKAMTRSTSAISFVPYHEVFDRSFEDMPRRVPDISKIRRTIGFEPTVQLDEILADVIEHWQVESSRIIVAPTPHAQPAVA